MTIAAGNTRLTYDEARFLSVVRDGEELAAQKIAAAKATGEGPADIEAITPSPEGVRVTVMGKPSTVIGGVDQNNASRPVTYTVADVPDAFGRVGLMAITEIRGSQLPLYRAPLASETDATPDPDETIESVTRQIQVAERRLGEIPSEQERCVTPAVDEQLQREADALVSRIRVLGRRLAILKANFMQDADRRGQLRNERVNAVLRQLLVDVQPLFDEVVEIGLHLEAMKSEAEDAGVPAIEIAIADRRFGYMDLIVHRSEAPLTERQPVWPRPTEVKGPKSGRIFRRRQRTAQGQFL